MVLLVMYHIEWTVNYTLIYYGLINKEKNFFLISNIIMNGSEVNMRNLNMVTI